MLPLLFGGRMKRVIAVILAAVFLLLPVASWGAVDPVVMDAYYRDGGRITYHDTLYDGETPCYGVYYWKDKSIRIRKDAPDTTLSHEIGHWLYHRQVWSGTLQDMANKAFAESPLRELTDENFALGYAMYCDRGLGGGLADFYKHIEDITVSSIS